ncbi:MAG TPA: cytochrome c oxidase subunit 3 [Planctomycetota bacterium]
MTAPPARPLDSPAGTAVLEPPPRRARSGGPPRPPEDGGGGDGGRGGGDGARGEGPEDIGRLALGLALLGISTLFAVLIAVALLLRRPAPDWRGGARPPLGALWASSACLLLSSLAAERAARRARAGSGARRAVARGLATSLALGLAFVAAQVALWLAWRRAGHVPAASGYAAVFFSLTGLHALHVLGGLAFLGALWARWRRPSADPPAGSVRLGALYWHFMGVLWLVLVALFVLVR